MPSICPLCHIGRLQEIAEPGDRQRTVIRCSDYPVCRFEAQNWEGVTQAAARFHHPVQPGQA